jgi:biopolymer transport protein ExbD
VAAELNLVPFIDLMSTCIVFLLLTAVWTQTSALEASQRVGPAGDAVSAPLTVHVAARGVWVGRDADGTFVPRQPAGYDWGGVDLALAADRARHPVDAQLVLWTDDGVAYEHMVGALDRATAHGYDAPVVAGSR